MPISKSHGSTTADYNLLRLSWDPGRDVHKTLLSQMSFRDAPNTKKDDYLPQCAPSGNRAALPGFSIASFMTRSIIREMPAGLTEGHRPRRVPCTIQRRDRIFYPYSGLSSVSHTARRRELQVSSAISQEIHMAAILGKCGAGVADEVRGDPTSPSTGPVMRPTSSSHPISA